MQTDKRAQFVTGPFDALALEPDQARRSRIERVLNSQVLAVRVSYLETPEELLSRCEADDPQADLLLLTDVQPALIWRLRALKGGRRVPIVVMMPPGQPRARLEEYYRAGCSFCVRSGATDAEDELTLRNVLQFWFQFVILPQRVGV